MQIDLLKKCDPRINKIKPEVQKGTGPLSPFNGLGFVTEGEETQPAGYAEESCLIRCRTYSSQPVDIFKVIPCEK